MFQAPKLTDAGKALYYENMGGEQIRFTTIQMGNGSMTGPIAAMTALINPLVVIPAVVTTNSEKYVDISGQFSNADLETGFYWKEIGIFAANPVDPDDRGADILYCYQNAYDTADFIPVASVETVEKSITVPILVGDAATVSCSLSKSLIFATIKDLEEVERAKEPLIRTAEEKIAPVDTDGFAISDSADSEKTKRLTWANIKASLGQVFSSIVHTHTAAQVGADPAGSAAAAKGEAIQAAAADATAKAERAEANAKAASRPATWMPTAIQVGADPAGSAAGVQNSLNAFAARRDNPHGVTAAQTGALPLSGGRMTGDLNMGGKPIWGTKQINPSEQGGSIVIQGSLELGQDAYVRYLGPPRDPTDAVNKQYMEAALSTKVNMTSEICPDLDTFIEVNKYMAVTSDTQNRPGLAVVDFGRVINIGTDSTTFLQILYARGSAILYRGYAAWETPKFHRWRMVADNTPPQEHPLPLAAGVVVTRPSKYSRAQDGLVVVTYNLSFPASEGRTKVLFTLPAGYRPFVMISAPCIVSTSPGDVIAPATVEVYESGLVQVYANASGYTNSAGQIVFYTP